MAAPNVQLSTVVVPKISLKTNHANNLLLRSEAPFISTYTRRNKVLWATLHWNHETGHLFQNCNKPGWISWIKINSVVYVYALAKSTIHLRLELKRLKHQTTWKSLPGGGNARFLWMIAHWVGGKGTQPINWEQIRLLQNRLWQTGDEIFTGIYM